MCKHCGKSGWLVRVSNNGLCKTCEFTVNSEVAERVRVINSSQDAIEKSKKLDTQLSRYDFMIDQLSELKKYEDRGISTTTPAPSELTRTFREKKDTIAVETLQSEFQRAQEKARTAATARSRTTPLTKMLLRVQDYRNQVSSPEVLSELEATVSSLIHKTQLDGLLEAAKKAEFKGQKKKALDQYLEALYFLRTDDINDSLQQDNLKAIKSKIVELGGELPE